MKRIIKALLLLLLPAALMLQAAAVSADQNNKLTQPVVARPTLMIRTAAQITTKQPLNITIYSKYGRETIAGVFVYAVSMNDVVIAADSDNYTTLLRRYEALAISSGVLIGTTGTDGKLTGSLSQSGRYLLVASKGGFIPGFSRLTVTLSDRKALNIQSQGHAIAGQVTVIKVTERYSYQPVSGVAVYAQQIIRTNPADTPSAVTYAEQVKSSGIFLGNTGNDSILKYTFSEVGHYVLVAILDGCTPGFGRIIISNEANNNKQQLGIKATSPAYINKPVLFKVYDRENGQAAGNATIYGFKGIVNVSSPAIKPSPSSTKNVMSTAMIINVANASAVSTAEAEKLLLQSQLQPITLGVTGSNGEITYKFSEAATYTLVAFKDNYLPAGYRLNVIAEPLKKKQHPYS